MSVARCLLLVVILVSSVGLGVFLSGFLLTKTELRQRSYGEEHHDPAKIFRDIDIDNKSSYAALMRYNSEIREGSSRKGKRVFLFVVDALRFDLFQPSDEMEAMCERTMNLDAHEETNGKPRKRNLGEFTNDTLETMRFKHNNKFPDRPKLNYTSCTYNQFPFLHKLLLEDPDHAVLYKAYADPPTTTSQRLKGITTGSIPAFIELGGNFESAAITGDNIIHQAIDAGKKIAVIGDDTWEKLFPSTFHLSLPFESFNTMDLDTVDDGVEEALDQLIANNTLLNYDLVISHFLGIDHIGHTFNAFDILMGERLMRMDDIAAKIIDHLPDDGSSVFMLMGDHGMSDTGDHGGATSQETDTPLFVYKKGAGSVEDVSSVGDRGRAVEEIDQLDMAPLLARILNVPIPYTSIGTYIDLNLHTDKLPINCDKTALRDVLTNALQVVRYWDAYSKSAPLNKDSIGKVTRDVKRILKIALDKHTALFQVYKEDLQEMSNQECEQGILAYKEVFIFIKQHARETWTTFNNTFMIVGILVLATTICVTLLYLYYYSELLTWNLLPVYDKLLLTFVPIHTLTVFSNSFIENELKILFSMMKLAIISSLASQFYMSLGKWKGDKWIVHGLLPKPVQWGDGWENTWFSLLMMGFSLISLHHTYTNRGHSKHWTDLSLNMVHGTYLSSSIFPWLLVGVGDAMYYSYEVVKPFKREAQAVFFGRDDDYTIRGKWIDCISVGLFLHNWLIHLRMLGFAEHLRPVSSDVNPVNSIYFYAILGIFISLFRAFLAPYPSPTSSPVLIFCHMGSILALVSGPLGTYQFCMGMFPTLASPRKSIVGSILTAFFMGRFMFLASGHSYAFNTVQVEAGLIGLDEFHFYTSGMQLAVNTFGHGALLFLSAMYRVPLENLNETLLFALLQQTILLLATCISVFILQRHLMLWEVFAPRFIFEMAFYLVFVVMVFIVLLCSETRAYFFRRTPSSQKSRRE